MQRATWLMVVVGLWSCMHIKSMNVSQLEVLEDKKDNDASDEYPARRAYVFNFYGGDELLVMRCAGIEIDAYRMQEKQEQQKLIQAFGDASAPLFGREDTSEHAVYLRRLEICDDANKNQGLGKQLFLYGLIKMKQRYPKSVYFWIAQPLDGSDKRESLFRFYKNCGGTMLKNYGETALFYIDLAKLDLGIFKPERDMAEYLSVRSRL